MTPKPPTISVVSFVIAIVGLVLAAHLIGGGASSMLEGKLRNSLHAPGFAILALGALCAFRTIYKAPRAYCLAAILCLVVALVGEFLQSLGSRDAELMDLFHDILGTGSALFLAATFDPKLKTSNKLVLPTIRIIGCAVLLFVVLRPATWYSYALVQRKLVAPEILSFEHAWERELYYAYGKSTVSLLPIPSDWYSSGEFVAKIESGKSKYSGIDIEPFADWSSYETLSFFAGSVDGESGNWTVRIHDKAHNNDYEDRFTYNFETQAQPRKIRIPLDSLRRSPSSREMDLRSISSIIIFAQSADGDSAMYLDDLKLE